MTSTITTKQQQDIAAFLENRHIPSGLGTPEEACSIASINLALSGKLTDDIPDLARLIAVGGTDTPSTKEHG